MGAHGLLNLVTETTDNQRGDYLDYWEGWISFGGLSQAQVMRSLELFATRVMPLLQKVTVELGSVL